MNFFLPQRMAAPPTVGNQFSFRSPQMPASPQFGGMPAQMPPMQQFGGFRPQAPVQSPYGGFGQQFGAGGGGGMMSLNRLASYKYGTPYVPRTAPAMLHEGERVISAPMNKKLKKIKLNTLLNVQP
jgi:hypothetical protein